MKVGKVREFFLGEPVVGAVWRLAGKLASSHGSQFPGGNPLAQRANAERRFASRRQYPLAARRRHRKQAMRLHLAVERLLGLSCRVGGFSLERLAVDQRHRGCIIFVPGEKDKGRIGLESQTADSGGLTYRPREPDSWPFGRWTRSARHFSGADDSRRGYAHLQPSSGLPSIGESRIPNCFWRSCKP